MIIRDVSSGLVPIAEYENALKSLIFGEAAAKLHVKSTKVVEDNFAHSNWNNCHISVYLLPVWKRAPSSLDVCLITVASYDERNLK